MTRFGVLFSILAACAADQVDGVAHFQGEVGQSVTHVMAVSPVAGSLSKVVAPVVDGTFSVDAEINRPWALVFVDSSQRGAGMVRGILRADTLDTFVPAAGGVIDLGQISIDNHDATMAGSSESLDTALGVSRHTLATLGGIDDIALRYASPDIDADGMIDVEQGILCRLEMHAEYDARASGRAAAVVDFINNTDSITFAYAGTGIYGRLPDSFGTVDRDDADVTFEQPFHGYWAGPQTAPVAAGQPITQLTYGDDRTFGVFARPDRELPSGTYRFRSGPHALEFSFVRPPVEMTMHQVMPRMRFVTQNPACVRDCIIDTVEMAWARKTDAGWIMLTDEEAQVLRPVGSLDVVMADGASTRYDFPVGVATSSVPWDQTHTSADIVYGSIAFHSRPGMRMYAQFGDGSVAPPMRVFDPARR